MSPWSPCLPRRFRRLRRLRRLRRPGDLTNKKRNGRGAVLHLWLKAKLLKSQSPVTVLECVTYERKYKRLLGPNNFSKVSHQSPYWCHRTGMRDIHTRAQIQKAPRTLTCASFSQHSAAPKKTKNNVYRAQDPDVCGLLAVRCCSCDTQTPKRPPSLNPPLPAFLSRRCRARC
jgi:hypothetical protein